MEKMTIPTKIHVGYQERQDTYTGRLAYVIYTDEKGKLRKENSWTSWRNKKIDPDEYSNEPTSGFVLNKGVGGARQSWGWNARNEYIRVYDPRGFEFEISVANLLFILTHCNAIKGKGIEGEFVYAWDKADLILLPVGCFEYKTSTEFTSLKTMKVTKADMKEGCTYLHKDTAELVYLGRHKVRIFDRVWWWKAKLALLLQDPNKPKHVFWDLKKEKYRFETGFTRLAKVISEDVHSDFANLYTAFVGSEHVATAQRVVLKPIIAEDIVGGYCYRGSWLFIKVPGGYQRVVVDSYPWGYYRQSFPLGQSDKHFWPVQGHVLREVVLEDLCNTPERDYDLKDYAVSSSYLEGKELFTPEILLDSSVLKGVEGYVKRRTDQEAS
jgi:hypothetical protein